MNRKAYRARRAHCFIRYSHRASTTGGRLLRALVQDGRTGI